MPIPMTCQCGKALKIPDAMAGKAVKCPSCEAVLRVPVGGSAAPQPVAKPRVAAPQTAGGLDELFDEEGFAKEVGRVCPNCSTNLNDHDILCTKCGFHAEQGIVVQGHETAGVDIDHGTLALRKAAEDIKKSTAMQEKLARGAGMPWWGLALVLFMIVLGIIVGVLAVNSSRQIDENSTFDPIATFFQLSGAAFYVVSCGAYLMIVADAFKKTWWQGLLVLLVGPYGLYYICTNFRTTWKYFLVSICTGMIGIAMWLVGTGVLG